MKKLLPVYKAFLTRMILKDLDHNFDIGRIEEQLNYQASLCMELLKIESLDQLDFFIEGEFPDMTLANLDVAVRHHYKL